MKKEKKFFFSFKKFYYILLNKSFNLSFKLYLFIFKLPKRGLKPYLKKMKNCPNFPKYKKDSISIGYLYI